MNSRSADDTTVLVIWNIFCNYPRFTKTAYFKGLCDEISKAQLWYRWKDLKNLTCRWYTYYWQIPVWESASEISTIASLSKCAFSSHNSQCTARPNSSYCLVLWVTRAEFFRRFQVNWKKLNHKIGRIATVCLYIQIRKWCNSTDIYISLFSIQLGTI